ncbi:hypothetical protein [Endozoicomonas euniceicola]|uniref:Uncharacterized protein n=1 Tax=Endozoicomonas euniceicola TaxID=1234143 RepID=A0ABY6GPE1_9GAMM|nr:hypothetical protein [Endozoicomonas euniceicola]UYM14289.1 hypothetical protein NX720_15430 [Endozoicomonas euniceicola]
MDVPVFVSQKDLELIHIKKLAHFFRVNRLTDEDAEKLADDLDALNRLKASGLVSTGESLRCEKRIYKRYQALVREYGHQIRKENKTCQQK